MLEVYNCPVLNVGVTRPLLALRHPTWIGRDVVGQKTISSVSRPGGVFKEAYGASLFRGFVKSRPVPPGGIFLAGNCPGHKGWICFWRRQTIPSVTFFADMTLFNPYFDRDLSWLSFNERILGEAADSRVPLYDRVMFIGIYSSNLDEFFRVRVAALRHMVELRKRKLESRLDFDPKLLLYEVQKVVDKQLGELGGVFAGLLAELARNNVMLYTREPLPEAHRHFGRHYFRSHVLCFLQPVFLDARAKKPPHLAQGQLYFVLTLRPKAGEEGGAETYAYLNIPSDKLPRLVGLPGAKPVHYFAFLDDIIRANLDVVFPGHEVVNCFAVKLNRDEDLSIEDEYDGDLVEKIRKQLEKQHVSPPTRFLYDAAMPPDLLARVVNSLHLKRQDLVAGGRYHNLSDLQKLPNPFGTALASPSLPPLRHEELDRGA